MKSFKLPSGVTNKFGRQILQAQKVSPQLMFATGVIGVIGAGVLACRSTLKLSDTLAVHEARATSAGVLFNDPNNTEYTEKAYKKDLTICKVLALRDVVKLYAIPVGLAMVSIGLLTGSHITLNRRNAGLTAAYAAVSEAMDKYRGRVREELGAEKDEHFRHGVKVVEETIVKDDGKTKVVKHTRFDETAVSGYAKMFAEGINTWRPQPELNRIFLQSQQAYFNHILEAEGYLILNDVYTALGFERTGQGCVVGWVFGEGDGFVDFGIFDEKTGTGAVRDFVNGLEGSILLDFNVDGVIYDKIEKARRR